MKRFSLRMAAVDTPIIPAVAALVVNNPGTISLGQGVVNYGPPAEAIAALPGLIGDVQLNKYQAVMGYPALVDALRQKLAQENGIHAGSDAMVMVTAGSNMAFLNCVLAVGDPGDEFILPMPFYFNQEMAIRMCGCTPVTVATNDDWSLDVQALAAAITPRTRAIVTVSPNNPTGAVYSRESLAAVNALCAEKGIYHFCDEAYEYFTYDGATHFSPASLPGALKHTFSFFSMSKNYGMASWRLGSTESRCAWRGAGKCVRSARFTGRPGAVSENPGRFLRSHEASRAGARTGSIGIQSRNGREAQGGLCPGVCVWSHEYLRGQLPAPVLRRTPARERRARRRALRGGRQGLVQALARSSLEDTAPMRARSQEGGAKSRRAYPCVLFLAIPLIDRGFQRDAQAADFSKCVLCIHVVVQAE